MVSRILCVQLAWVLASASLAPASAFAGEPRRVIGRIIATTGVSLDGTLIPHEDTVFSGDLLMTPSAGTALVKFSPTSQANVAEESTVRFETDSAGHPRAQIVSGRMLASNAGKGIVVETAKYRIEPAEPRKAVYLVAVLPDKSTVVAARQGKLSITEIRSGKSYGLSEGLYAVMAASASGVPAQEKEESKRAPGKPAGQASPPTKEPPKAKEPKANEPWHIGSLSHGASIGVVAAGVGGGAAAGIAAASGGGGRSSSPSSP